jgi:beta-glucanase (GH16 family)
VKRLHIILVLLTAVFGCYKQSTLIQRNNSGLGEIVWADEFNYSGLPDPQKWGFDVGGHGWGNRELQYYTDRRKENARVESGNLIIEVQRDNWAGREYTSARLISKGKGTWASIWMLSALKTYGDGEWPDNGEIDIMEHVGFDPDMIYAGIHTRSYHHSINTHKTGKIHLRTARTGFNVYAVEWTPEEIRAYVNEQHYFTFENERLTNPAADYRQWPFDRPFYLIMNIAVGGTWGGARGLDQSIWPQRMEIDYVRVYRSPHSN